MTARLTWVDEQQTVIHLDLQGAQTWEDCAEAFDRATALAVNVPQTVHRIVDMRGWRILPQDSPWCLIRRMAFVAPRAGGMIVHVSDPVLSHSMARAYQQRFADHVNDVRFVTSLEEAYELLDMQPVAAV